MKTILILGLASFSIASPLFASTDYCGAVWNPALEAGISSSSLAVTVKVEGPENDSARAESYIRHKLGEQPDGGRMVVFKETNAPFALHVALRPTQDANSSASSWQLEAIAQTAIAPLGKELVASGVASDNHGVAELRWTVTGTTETLKQLCEKVAARFDRKMLDRERERRDSGTSPIGDSSLQAARASWGRRRGDAE